MFLMHVYNKMRRSCDDKHALLLKLFKLMRKKVYFISAFNIYSELHVSYLVHTLVNMEINE